MTVITLPRSYQASSVDTARMTWWDDEAECNLVMSTPDNDPELWHEYLSGAQRLYRKHGVGAALEIDALADGGDTTLFWAAVGSSGKVLGGVRAVGPLTAPEDSHALVEWDGQPGQRQVRKMISDRVPLGVVEMKSAWVTDEAGRNRQLTAPLARSAGHVMTLLGAQFCMATSAAHVLERWRTSGGVVASIRATPYPDERYRTKMLWWDRRTMSMHAQPSQLVKMFAEMADIRRVHGSVMAMAES